MNGVDDNRISRSTGRRCPKNTGVGSVLPGFELLVFPWAPNQLGIREGFGVFGAQAFAQFIVFVTEHNCHQANILELTFRKIVAFFSSNFELVDELLRVPRGVHCQHVH